MLTDELHNNIKVRKMEKIRLSKFFSDCGIMSRRAAEEEIKKGKVTVNGSVAVLGEKIDPDTDEIIYNGRQLKSATDTKICIMLNKPRGIVCTASDEKGRDNVTDLCRDVKDKNGNPLRLYPVGRLDMDSDGLLLLTNDGSLTNKLTHPRHSIPKIYHVTLKGRYSAEELAVLGEPIEIDGKMTIPVKVTKVGEGAIGVKSERGAGKTENTTVACFELYEGRNRQIRRMCECHNVRILKLTRVAIGKIRLGNLPTGKWRYLDEKEIHYLKTV